MGLFDKLGGAGKSDKKFTPKLRLRNHTGYDIYELYISASDADDWEENLLEDDEYLADGDVMNISFEVDSPKRLWDIRVVDEEGDETEFTEIDLSKYSRVTLYYDEENEACADCD